MKAFPMHLGDAEGASLADLAERFDIPFQDLAEMLVMAALEDIEELPPVLSFEVGGAK